MKYVRTKDGKIYNKSKIICSAFREEYCSPNWNEDIEKYLQTKIVAEADTIEELVDDFIAKKDYGKPFVIKRYEIHSNLQFGFTIYGAIWVVGENNEPILKPVAKMKEEGGLELL